MARAEDPQEAQSDTVTTGISRRPPHLAFLCIVCVLSGISILTDGPTPGSAQEAMDPLLLRVWALSLIVGGAAILVTFFDRIAVRGLRRERLMLVPFSLTTVAYVVALFATVPNKGAAAFAASITLAFVGANVWRVGQITRWLRALAAAIPGPTDG